MRRDLIAHLVYYGLQEGLEAGELRGQPLRLTVAQLPQGDERLWEVPLASRRRHRARPAGGGGQGAGGQRAREALGAGGVAGGGGGG